MTQEIIQRIREYCERGLLEGLEIDASWLGNKFRMVNVRIASDDTLRFDQFAWRCGCWESCQTDAHVSNQVSEYLRDCLAEIERLVNIDKNLF